MQQQEKDQYSNLVHSLHEIQHRLGIHFSDETLLIQAFVHKSFLNEANFSLFPSYERLEFLGDSILNLATADYLFRKETQAAEGTLSQMKAQLVSQKRLAQTISNLGISHYLLTGKGERLHKLYLQETIQADLFESILGALFIDQGWDIAKEFVFKNHIIHCNSQELVQENPKAALQELCLKKKQGLPRYSVIKEEGPQHDPMFTVGVYIQETLIKEASGKNKRQAEAEAAKGALLVLTQQLETAS